MEIDVKKQEVSIREELAQLQGRLAQLTQQAAAIQQEIQPAGNLTALVLKKMGALELLQSLDGKKEV